MLKILYEDQEIIVVWKPVGVESQSARGFGADMVSEIRRHIHKLSTNLSPKGGMPYVGVIHRLDKPVSGIMVYGKTKKAAAALSEQVAKGQMTKKYLAVLCGKVDKNVDNFVDYMLKDEKENCSRLVDMGMTGAKRAELGYRVVEKKTVEPYGELTLAEIALMTGRHHQIRVQMAGHGLPLWGDHKYNPQFSGHGSSSRGSGSRSPEAGGIPDTGTRPPEAGGIPDTGTRPPEAGGAPARVNIGLSAFELTFTHPVSGKRMTFRQMPREGIFREFT